MEGNNLALIHGKCADDRQKAWQEANKGKVLSVGDYVRLGFPIENPVTGRPTKENLWVKITELKEDIIVGALSNYPVFINLSWGDIVEFTFDEICEWGQFDLKD
jgi:uncharacterized protein YegJ (DUF2314 family)